MPVEWCYRGREISTAEIAFLRQFIAEHSSLTRWSLSRRLCEAWQWKQPNGALCDALCRGLLLKLERGGAIELPPRRKQMPNRLLEPNRPEPVVPDNRPVRGSLKQLGTLDFQQVRRTRQEPLFNSLL